MQNHSRSRIGGVDPRSVDGYAQKLFAAQAKTWGAPLANHLIYARRPKLLRAVRGMWNALDHDTVLGERLVAMVNRRVAKLNGCEF